MNMKDINKLLQKFYRGETDLEEERYLSDHFRQSPLPSDSEHDRDVFLALSHHTGAVPSGLKQRMDSLIDALEQEEKKAAPLPVKKLLPGRIIGLVASLLLVAAIGLRTHFRGESNSSLLADTYDSPQQAHEAAINALQLFSHNFSRGAQSVGKVDKQIEETLEIINQSLTESATTQETINTSKDN